jgi:hypothetical protein
VFRVCYMYLQLHAFKVYDLAFHDTMFIESDVFEPVQKTNHIQIVYVFFFIKRSIELKNG